MPLNLQPSAHFSTLNCTEEEYLDALHQVFKSDLVSAKAPWAPSNCVVSPRRMEEYNGLYATFWHIVSEGGAKDFERSTDLKRCTRLHWIRPLLGAFDATYPNKGDGGSIHWWVADQNRTNFTRYIIATHDFEYLIIIEDKGSYEMLVSAYDPRPDRRRRKFQKSCEEYWETRAAQGALAT